MGKCWGMCMGRCRGASLSSRPQRGSAEKVPEEPERTKNKERTRKQKPVLFGRVSSVRGTFSAVSSIGDTFWVISSVGGTFWAVSSVDGTVWAASRVGGTLLAVLRVGGTFWRYLELAVLFGGSVKNRIWRYFFGGNAIRRSCFGGRRFFVFRR